MDKKRKRIGILFNFKSRWIGGIYYILNIIKSLDYLEDQEKPELIIFYNDRTAHYLDNIKYPYLTTVNIKVDYNFKRYLKSLIFGKNYFFAKEFNNYKLDSLYPFNDFIGKVPPHSFKLLSWIPDFQHKFYPEYFGDLELFFREIKFKNIVKYSNGLILSSNSAKNHLESFYKTNKLNTHVINFTSIIEQHELLNATLIAGKYGLKRPYFIVSNQFYKHKNHLIVLKALAILKDKKVPYKIVFTGKPDREKDNILIEEIEEFIQKEKLEKHVKLLGHLPRNEQLTLMKNSIAVIQPSKFEGWSTVIEDAKSLKKPMIASSIDVHLEQLEDNALYFDPDDPQELANCMTEIINNEVKKTDWESMSLRTEKFARAFLKIV